MAKRGKKSMQTAAADPVTIQYNSNTIGTLADSGRVTLKCADKRMLSDVEINYGVENYAPSAVTSTGDVTVTYGEETIGTLSDSGTLSFSTGGARVLHDINVNYTKPQTGVPVGNIVNIVNNTSDNIMISGARSMVNSNGVISTITINSNSTNNGYIFCRSGETPSSYLITFNCEAATDKYNITTNSTPWAYDNSELIYQYEITNDQPITGQTYNVVIANKV